MILCDTHAHLNDVSIIGLLDELLLNARAAGVQKIVIPATDRKTSEQIIRLTASRPDVFSAVGIHPNDSAKAAPDDWDAVVELTRTELANGNAGKIVAIGESGLDRYWDDAPMAVQLDYLNRHLDLAREFDLPIILHCREAESDLIPALQAYRQKTGWMKGILHSFSSDVHNLELYLDLGLYIGFGGMITYKQKKFDPVRDAAFVAPLDRILIETDCPYLTPSPMRGKVEFNQSAYVVHTAQELAEIKKTTLEEIACATTENAIRLLKI